MDQNKILCSNCGAILSIELGYCAFCHSSFNLVSEQLEVNKTISHIEEKKSDYRIGDSVIIMNEQHPWFREIALVSDTRHKFVRVELFGGRVWLPDDWVQIYED